MSTREGIAAPLSTGVPRIVRRDYEIAGHLLQRLNGSLSGSQAHALDRAEVALPHGKVGAHDQQQWRSLRERHDELGTVCSNSVETSSPSALNSPNSSAASRGKAGLLMPSTVAMRVFGPFPCTA